MICGNNSTTSFSPMSIYLDHNATSPMHAPVIGATMPTLKNRPANQPGLHDYARRGATENVSGLAGAGKAARSAWLEIGRFRLQFEGTGDPSARWRDPVDGITAVLRRVAV